MKNKRLRTKLAIAALATCVMGTGTAYAAYNKVAGPQTDGTAYTPNGWHVTPVGIQKPAGFFPANAVLSPDGKAVLVPDIIKNGNDKQAVQVLDAKDGGLIQEIELSGTGQGVAPGLAFSHDGSRVYLATANMNSVIVFGWNSVTSKLTQQKTLTLPGGTYPQGVAVSPDDKTLYVSGAYKKTLVAVDVASGSIATAPTGEYPYGVALSADGHTAYVSNQAENTLSVFFVNGLTLTPQSSKLTVGTHPNSLLLDAKRNRLYVANGDSDSVSVIDTVSNVVVNTISMAPYPGAPTGTSPTNMTLSPDSGTLYVTNSGNNDVAVVNVSDQGEFGQIKGLIPTGWYPSGVQVTPDGKLLVTSARGLGTGPNNINHTYMLRLLQGYLSIIPLPSESQLKTYTRMVRENNGFDEHGKVSGFDKHFGGPNTIIPRNPGESSPIKHIIYIVKENRTYDEVFGDLKNADGTPRGNGDPSMTLFGQDITPNQHKLAQQFVTLDNFYSVGEVSQNGWAWSTGANSNLFNQLGTSQAYGGSGAVYDSEGQINSQASWGNVDPNRAYLWNAVAAAGMTFRNYGMHLVKGTSVGLPSGKVGAYEPVLNANTDHDYPMTDLNVSDVTRFNEWNKEFQQNMANDSMPTFQFIRLLRDHTNGAATAKQLVADNDLALGKVVDTVSHSKYWNDTAIFVLEDDAQAGFDHVDAHRTIAQVISPYTQRGIVDSHLYSQLSMLRTMELLVGLGPLTQFDAAAMPMIYSFGDKPNFNTYTALTPVVTTSLAMENDMNPIEPDMVDQQKLSEELWRAIKGPDIPMPASKNHIFGSENEEEENTGSKKGKLLW
ncbi:beta-propeller fold lactonase family protein [Paenibacillus sp. LMG 31458]|uniref:Beta-propeller fold lactonase family protein n=1 Tax=Paenibacillus phytorum TaxID=2654977 RepID=A0ABX1Y0Z6_9BACL|nr:bifunctional YncE family protein/alkaline phosphatase family protein [Paenibacillus phytorum]NOU74530.1 beta-propeller fold lactonase family protein [Paenibacillus phytorum]